MQLIINYTGEDDIRLAALLEFIAKHSLVTVRELAPIPGESNLAILALSGQTHTINPSDLRMFSIVTEILDTPSMTPALDALNGQPDGFEYQGLKFSSTDFHLFAGLNAVDTPASVECVMKALQARGLNCTRMGIFKPRTNPYHFQGHGIECLDYVFPLARKYGIKIIAMEVTDKHQIEAIADKLDALNNPTGVMLQIGTRNAQNFELLRAVGEQTRFPVLYKRGLHTTVSETLQAIEYILQAGNRRVVICLRGLKSGLASPHRNLVDFAHVPVFRRLTSLPICIDPSHSTGVNSTTPDGIPDIFHITAQGIIAGATNVLTDIHPEPVKALVDSRQCLNLNQLDHYLDDIDAVRQCYARRLAIAEQHIASRE